MMNDLPHLDKLATERQNPRSAHIDSKSTEEILQIINNEDRYIPEAVSREIPGITMVVDKVVEVFKKGGRLFYVGAGTSGRMGMLDASECPSTFGTDPEMVQGIIAGGHEALTKTVDWIEDNEEHGKQVILEHGVTSSDILIGISASGYAPFVMGAMKKARETGAVVVFFSCNPTGDYSRYADYQIILDVGPEIIAGSTRLKSGTAQKMVLNMITTAAMIKLGKVYNNLMVDLRPVNSKLVKRSINIIKLATGCNESAAEETFVKAGKNIKTAIIMILLDVEKDGAVKLLKNTNGSISKAVHYFLEHDNK